MKEQRKHLVERRLHLLAAGSPRERTARSGYRRRTPPIPHHRERHHRVRAPRGRHGGRQHPRVADGAACVHCVYQFRHPALVGPHSFIRIQGRTLAGQDYDFVARPTTSECGNSYLPSFSKALAFSRALALTFS